MASAVFVLSGAAVFADSVTSNPVSVYIRPKVSCSASSSNAFTNQSVTWTATVLPALSSGSYSYSWTSGGATLASGDATSASYVVKYGSVGSYTASVTVTPVGITAPSGSLARTALCDGSVQVTGPNLIPTVLSDTNTSHPKIYSTVVNPNGSCKVNSDIVFTLNPKNIGSTFTSPTFYNKIQKAAHGQVDFVDVGTTPSVTGGLAYNTGITDNSVQATYTWQSTDKNPGGYDFRYCVDMPPNDGVGNVVEGKPDGTSGENDNCSDVVATCSSGYLPATVDLQVRTSGTGSYLPTVPPSPAPNYTYNANYGDSVDLQWTTTNAASCSATWTPQVGTSGIQTKGPLSNTTQSYSITCRGLDGVDVTSNTITVSVNPPTVSCTGTLSGLTGNWSATPTPLSLPSPGPTYSYVWSGTDIPAGTTGTMAAGNASNFLTITYTTAGTKTASVTLTPSGTGQAAVTAACTPTAGLVVKPDLTPLDPPNKPEVKSGTTNTSDSKYRTGTAITFTVKPKNIGAGFTSPLFKIGLQKKLHTATVYPSDTNGPVFDATADVANGTVIAQGATAPMQKDISITLPTTAGDYDFRYCADLPPDNPGNVSESNENNNCSGDVTVSTSPGTCTDLGNCPVTADLYVTYNSTDYLKNVKDGTMNVAYASSPVLKWTSTNATECTGTNFSTGGALNNTTGVAVGPLSNATQTYSITCTGPGLSGSDTATVTVSSPSLSCTGTLSGLTSNWSATPTPLSLPSPGPTYSYVWSGTDIPAGTTGTMAAGNASNFLTITYTTAGTKTASVTMTPSGTGQAAVTASCTPNLTTKPDLTPLGAAGATPGPNAPVITSETTNPDGTVVAGTSVTFRVDPANIGGGFSSPAFNVKLQGRDLPSGTFADLETASVSGGLDKGSTVNNVFTPSTATKSASITHPSGATETRSFEFRYCVDLPPNTATGSIDELKSDGHGEDNNCSGVTAPVPYELRPTPLVTLQVRNSNTAPSGTYRSAPSNNPLSISYTDKVDLTWTSSNIVTNGCTASSVPTGTSGSWSGTGKAASGTDLNIGPLVNAQYVYTITCTAISGASATSATDSVTVNVGLPSVSCAGSPTTVFTDETVTWTATPAPTSGLPTGTFYNYTWASAGASLASQGPSTSATYQVSYAGTGSKAASVVLTAPGGRTVPASGTQACSNPVTVNPTIPTVTLSARASGTSDSFVTDALSIQDKTNVDLKWVTTNGPTSCVGTATEPPGTTNAQVNKWNGDSKSASGGTDNTVGNLLSIQSPVTFKIVCSKAGVADISSTVAVTIVSPIFVYMEAAVNPVPYNTSPVLSWSTRGNPTTCNATVDWTGSKSTSSATSTETISPPITVPKTYTITCTKNKALDAPFTVPVGVQLARPTIPTIVTKACSSVNDNGKIDVTMTTVTGATSYKLYRNTSDTSPYPTLVGTYAGVSPSFTITDSGLAAGSTYFYQVEAAAAGGQSSGFSDRPKSAVASRCVLPTCTLTATPASITRDIGNSSKLEWSTTDAVSVASAGSSGATAIPNFPTSGPTNLNGSISVTPTTSTTYGITATNLSGSKSCTTPVTVIVRALSPACSASALHQADLSNPAQNDPNQTVQIDLKTNQNVTWTATGTYELGRLGGVPPYTYSWAGDSPLAGQTGGAPSISYSFSGVKSGQVTVTDSQPASVTADCSNKASVTDSRCDFGMIPNPSTIKMTFIGNTALSQKSNITVYPPECSQTITLSPTSMTIGGVPVTLNFFTHNSNTPDTVIEPGTYVNGLDVNVTARQFIKPGKYPMLLNGSGNAVDPLDRNKPTTERPLTITLDVATSTPKFQEF